MSAKRLDVKYGKALQEVRTLTAELEELRESQKNSSTAGVVNRDTNAPAASDPEKTDDLDEKLQKEGDRYREMLEKDITEESSSPEDQKQHSWLTKLFQNARSFCYDQICPIGIDIEDECITLVQLSTSRDGMNLIDAKKLVGPYGIDVESDDWGKWAVSSLREAMRGSKFRSRKVSLAVPVRDTFIDHLILPEADSADAHVEVFQRMQKHLPYEATQDNTIIKIIPSEKDRVLAIALERPRIETYLAMCEKARLKPQVFSVWPMAMANCYSLLWTRKDDTFVMLFDVAMHYTNVVICRNKTLYYARTIPMGAQDLESSAMIQLLCKQISDARKQFKEYYNEGPIERNIFFAGQAADRKVIAKIVNTLHVPAQMGDPFGVVKINNGDSDAVDAKKCRPSWSVAFGLSLQPKMNDPMTKQLLYS
jgi:Tfp pilus assembly PilM family ATPase